MIHHKKIMANQQSRVIFSCVLIILCLSGVCVADYDSSSPTAERIIQTLEDNMDAENFTYYRLLREGDLRIELISVKGDVDIYGSSKVQHPSYSDYEIKSCTCGMDTIFVPEEMPRPVYIAIFGHPSYLHSQFRLNIYLVTKSHSESYEDLVAKYENYYFDDGEKSKEKESRQSKSEYWKSKSKVQEEDEQPLWVTILLGILEFGINVII